MVHGLHLLVLVQELLFGDAADSELTSAGRQQNNKYADQSVAAVAPANPPEERTPTSTAEDAPAGEKEQGKAPQIQDKSSAPAIYQTVF
jgi:hypothetical protein